MIKELTLKAVPYLVMVTTRYVCAIEGCPSEYVHEQKSAVGMQLMSPFLPPNWHQNFGLLICPKHTISLIVDNFDSVKLT